MKTKLTVLGICLFVVSFFLPAYDVLKGWECANFCVWDVFGIWNDDIESTVVIFYYFSFTFSNILMLMIPLLLLKRYQNRAIPKAIITTQVILLLHVISWFFQNAYDSTLGDLRAGYYVWLLSMIVILCASLLSRKKQPA